MGLLRGYGNAINPLQAAIFIQACEESMTTETTPAPLLAYHGDKRIKSTYLKRVRDHRKADQLVQGFGYWQDGRGCAVGCTIHGSSHEAYETELGIPRQIAYLEDRFFESLPKEIARQWPERFLSAITPGRDLSLVLPRFMEWLLIEDVYKRQREYCDGVPA